MKRTAEYGIVFAVGAVGYAIIELLWRGRTHWTMVLTGGACLVLIYLIQHSFADAPLWKRCFAGAQVITLLELAVGFLVNVWLGWAVWDYSDVPLNLFGQICPFYSVLWFLLCIPATRLCKRLEAIIANIPIIGPKRLST